MTEESEGEERERPLSRLRPYKDGIGQIEDDTGLIYYGLPEDGKEPTGEFHDRGPELQELLDRIREKKVRVRKIVEGTTYADPDLKARILASLT